MRIELSQRFEVEVLGVPIRGRVRRLDGAGQIRFTMDVQKAQAIEDPVEREITSRATFEQYAGKVLLELDGIEVTDGGEPVPFDVAAPHLPTQVLAAAMTAAVGAPVASPESGVPEVPTVPSSSGDPEGN